MKQMVVLIGNYGSGKTEIALNLAVNAAGKGMNTLVIDLDKVNDYFRMSDKVQLLTDRSINVVSPTFAGQGVTPSNMSAAVASAFDGDWDYVVFDVGGDAAGALSLGRYHTDFAAVPPETLHVYDIVNGGLCPASGDGLREQRESPELRERRRSAPRLRRAEGDE